MPSSARKKKPAIALACVTALAFLASFSARQTRTHTPFTSRHPRHSPSVARACVQSLAFLFFFNDTATPEISTLSLPDALPIWYAGRGPPAGGPPCRSLGHPARWKPAPEDRKSTRLNSSHDQISYAVFCLK